ncbi:MAG: hypothetical protein ABIJ47_01690 [Candidatus Bathyarchaeota archaeon]
MSRRTRQRRPRPRRDKGQGIGAPSRSMAEKEPYTFTERDVEALRQIHATRSWQAQRTDEHLIAPIAPSPSHWIKHPGRLDVPGVDYPDTKARKAMEKRSEAAQRTDKALEAPLAPTPEEWMKHPEKYDYPGVDTRQKTEAKEARVDEQKIGNPMAAPDAAKKFLADVVEKYRRKLDIKGPVKLSAQNRGTPARIRHFAGGRTPQIEVNYSHFAGVWEKDPELTQKYLEYAIAHELSHQKQYEDLGHKGYRKAFSVAKVEGEWDADQRALKAMGITGKDLDDFMDRLAKKSGGVHEKAHPPFKGTPNIERFKDTTPLNKPKSAPERMRELYVKALGGVLPTATQEELKRITEKAMAEEWIKPGDEAKSAMKRVGDLAKAELVKLRQEKAHLEREEQLKRLKELKEKHEAKTSDEERSRQRLATLREDYGVQYDTALSAAMDINVKGYSRKLYGDLIKMGYSQAEAAEISSTFNEGFINRIQGEALKKQRQEAMDLARDAFGEVPELWEDAVKKYMATEVAQRPIPGMVEAAYREALSSVRDRTKPEKPPEPIAPKEPFSQVTQPEYNRKTGMYEVVRYDPEKVRTTKKQFKTLEEAERYRQRLKEAEQNAPAAPKPTVKTRSESYDFYSDPGHGWLRVPIKRLEELGIADDISNASYVKGGYAYLEEDRDATIFLHTLGSLGVKVGLRDHTANRESSIRGYQPYVKPREAESKPEADSPYSKAKRIILAAKTPQELDGIIKAVYFEERFTEEEKTDLAEYARARHGNMPDQKRQGNAALNPTEEARRQYDETMADRVPRMVKTWRMNLGRALTDQGLPVEAAEKYMNRLTAEAVQSSQAEYFAENRMQEGAIDERVIVMPEVTAERDALGLVQNKYEKLKKEALEEWANARRKTTAISQSPEIKRIMEGYKTEQPPQQGATVKATPSMRSRVASMSFNEANALIRDCIKAACPTVSVRRGRGTAAGWLDISGSKEFGNFTDAEKQQLATLGITASSNVHSMDFDDKARFIERNKLLDEPAPKPKDEVVIDIPDKKPAATYDAETEKIIKRIMDEKEVSRVLVEKRIEEEKAQKAGLITTEAAATFVAYQMLGEPVGKTAWAKISMNQMGGYFRVNEYSPTLDKVLHDNVAFKTREEAQAYVDRVNNPAGSETLPSLKKATAFSPEFNKESGMYEVEVYNPETRRKSRKQFSTPDKAEQYQKLVNDNPGWPTEGFKERLGSKQGLPMHLITAENSKSRGDEALKYDVYERLPPNAKRGDKYVDDRWYKYVASGTTEYKEAPGKEKLVEDLAKEYLNKGSVEVEFSPNPHWTPALSQVERLEPAQSSYNKGKWRVQFYGRDGHGDKREEGIGERWFDTYGEAMDFIKEGRGRYEQRGVQREGIWAPISEPPQLPKELESFTGKQDRFEVDPQPRYTDTWNQELKRKEYHWVFKNQVGGNIHTLDQLKDEHQKGEWRRRDRTEAAKSSRTITRKKGMSGKAWDHVAMPVAEAVGFNNNAVIEAQGDTVAFEGMDQSHVALMVLRVPNNMSIPEGKYEVADFDTDKRVTHRRHPKKLEWDNVERTLTVANENQKSYIRYEKVHDFQNRFPVPRVGFDARIKLDMKELQKAADGGAEHLALKVSEGRSALDSSFTYHFEKDEKQTVTHGEGADAWTSEENVKVPVSGTVGEVEKADKDEVKAVYTTSYLSDHLGSLVRAGFRDATLEYAEDMPLKITATRDDGAYAEFWLAPCIGV